MPETVTETPTETETPYVPFPDAKYEAHSALYGTLLEIYCQGKSITGEQWQTIRTMLSEATGEAWCRGYRDGFIRGQNSGPR